MAEQGADPKRKRAKTDSPGLRAQRSRPRPIFWLLIAWLTIAEQDHSLGVGKTRNGVLQDLFHKPLVPYSRGKATTSLVAGSITSACQSCSRLLPAKPQRSSACRLVLAMDPLIVEPQGRIRWIGVPS